ncbi:hypothetical protein ABW20_dc0108618 [Dactylellina cionopaga]|nr:hypothetical protein ABW20_dc0108618 [Dactylellina cionopaga]
MNVLVYSGLGTTAESVKHCLDTLRKFLSPRYAVAPISADAIIQGRWLSTCSLLCLPGGADLGFCKALNGTGNRYIQQYVRRGGKFIGFCAGAYFASADIEFEKGDPSLEVTGTRELRFFPGLCQGAAFKGFRYNSEAGARACILAVTGKLLDMGAPVAFTSYYNGGGIFVDAEMLADKGVEILARYKDIDVGQEDTRGNVAAVGCQVGAGYAFLIGTHPEFAAEALNRSLGPYPDALKELEVGDFLRVKFVSSVLRLLGLTINSGNELIQPPLSDLHLSSLDSNGVQEVIGSLKGLIKTTASQACKDDRHEVIFGGNDIFLLDNHDTLYEAASLPPTLEFSNDNQSGKTIFRIKVYNKIYPTVPCTPSFDHSEYFQRLRQERFRVTRPPSFGSPLLYGEVVTSTNTLLDKNFKLLQKLPTGFTVVATRQTAARGRGDNVWVSPIGALVFSMVVRHESKYTSTAPVVFIQHLVALAIVDSIKSYDTGYENLPVYLKWPNDIYARNASQGQLQNDRESLIKIGGILVTANFSEDEFLLVIGCGINVTNEAPTTSLKVIVESQNPPVPLFERERLLAKILVTFEIYYTKFLNAGFGLFEKDYYRHWLHSNQIVTMEGTGHTKAQIKGISMEDGMLIVQELDEHATGTGKMFKLQTDGNSFDFFNGLLRKKI